MCGIIGVVSEKKIAADFLIKACNVISHRGPDDEGFLTWNMGELPRILAGADTNNETRRYWNYEPLNPEAYFNVGFGHRRLSILDLSPAGHQPMLYHDFGLAITFNGEIYNYIEIRDELEKLGHTFSTKTDTEVILHAWAQWGAACLQRFNGMFAFLILDYKQGKLYAVRDRFGVKPLYYCHGSDGTTIFASEIKQIRLHKSYRPSVVDQSVINYLALGRVDDTSATFDENIHQIAGGSYMEVNIAAGKGVRMVKWYDLQPKAWKGSWEEAIEAYRNLFADAINIRLRADVKVGSCLSGGLDSSSIVCVAAKLLQSRGDFAGQETVTASYADKRFDEWNYAAEAIKESKARPHRVFPDFEQLKSEFDKFLWHQDEPTGSTSQFSQWAVFKETNAAGLKVMIDGQGADEQLAGYGGNDIPLYTGLLKTGRLWHLLQEARNYKGLNGVWPYSYLIGAAQSSFGKGFTKAMPQKYQVQQPDLPWVASAMLKQPSAANSLKDGLYGQVYGAPLPSLLRYEDRNSMAWGVESRTPFMDYRLLEFTFGLPDDYIYKYGNRKRILREAMQGIVPQQILNRTDKMGFVTPEELWLKGEGRYWFKQKIGAAMHLLPDGVNSKLLMQDVSDIMDSKKPFSFLPWRVCLLTTLC